MKRREALRIFAAGAALPAFSPELFALFRQAQPPPGYTMRTLTGHLNDTVVAMIDQIIPATDTPGAKGAKVDQFIDLILTEWATDEEKAVFLEGLEEADRRASELFGHGFAAASPKEQAAIVQGFDDELAAQRNEKIRGWIPLWEVPKMRFFEQMRKLTLTGYYTSTIGQEQELKVEIIPGALHGCVPEGPEVKQ